MKSKKILAGVLAAAMMFGSYAVVGAAGSRTKEATLVGENAADYSVSKDIENTESFQALKESAPEVANLIRDINKGDKKVADVVSLLRQELEGLEDAQAKEQLEEVISKLEDKEFVSGFFDLDLAENAEAEKNENGKYDVTLSVPALTEQLEDVNILHYSVSRSLWEVIEPTEVNLEDKIIEAEFEDFSPVAIIAKADGMGEN